MSTGAEKYEGDGTAAAGNGRGEMAAIRSQVAAAKGAKPDEKAGRGLPIVSTLAQKWGVDRPGADGSRKEVWAVLAFR